MYTRLLSEISWDMLSYSRVAHYDDLAYPTPPKPTTAARLWDDLVPC
jgi:hypothetical protein